MNNPDERGEPHLWAHVQEGVLADAGKVLGDETLVDVARASAKALLVPIVRSGFERPSVTPTTSRTVFSSIASRGSTAVSGPNSALARSWFDQVDRAADLYDREAGRVADGVDEGG